MAHQRMSQFGYETDEGHVHDGPMRRAYVQAEDLVRDHLGYSALATFGIGVGVGVATALLLAPRPHRKKSWYEHYLPEDLSAERMSRQVCQAVSHLLPDAVAQYFKKR